MISFMQPKIVKGRTITSKLYNLEYLPWSSFVALNIELNDQMIK